MGARMPARPDTRGDYQGDYGDYDQGRDQGRDQGYDQGYDQRRRRSRKPWLIAAIAIIVLAAGGVVAYVSLRPAPKSSQWVSPPTAAPVKPVLAGLATDAQRPSPDRLASMLQPLLADSRLGPKVRMSVIDVSSGEPLFDYGGTTGAVPASTTKLVTAAAVLHARGPAYQMSTRAVLGSSPGEVVLIGGGDPTLSVGSTGAYPGAARLDVLAAQVLKALGGQKPTKVTVDVSLYDGPPFSPNWEEPDRGESITNIMPLMTDGGLKDPKRNKGKGVYAAQPEMAAGQAFAAALGLPKTAVSVGRAIAGADQLGEVLSLPISRLVEIMLTKSDNIVAEAMARQVALAKGKPASFAGGSQATRDVLSELKIDVSGLTLVDGSGLSYDDAVTAQLLTSVLTAAASTDHPDLRPIVSGLPVAGFSGTLEDRYQGVSASAAGTVRAKTGTLLGVSSLAGLAVDADGRLLAFSVLADAAPASAPAEQALDRIAAAVASCGC